MSCSSFLANQFRLFLHAAAYVLLLEAKQRLFARNEQLRSATTITFRKRILLHTARITELKTKINSPLRALTTIITGIPRELRKRKIAKQLIISLLAILSVGITGLEPATSRPPDVCATNCAKSRSFLLSN